METQEVSSVYQITLFLCEGDQALALVAQRDFGVPPLQYIQKPCGQPSLGGPA